MKKDITKKAKKAVTAAGANIAKNPHLWVYGLLGLAGILGIYYVAKGAKSLGNSLSGDNIDRNIDVSRNLNINDRLTTITRDQARLFAKQLLEAFNWKVFFPYRIEGTDTKVVDSIFKRINSEDFKLIYQEFGQKDYNGFGSPPDNFGGGVQDTLGISEKRDLVYWLQSEIGFFDFGLKSRVKKIVEQAGFVF